MTAHKIQQYKSPGLAGGWRGEIIALLAAMLAAIVLLAAGYSRAWPLTIDIGGQDRRFIDPAPPLDPTRGFHAVEDFGGTAMRWTTGDATIAIPRPPDGAALLTLQLLNSRPAGQPDPRVALSADGRALGTFEVARTLGGGRIYRVLVPGATRLDWATRVNLRVDPITLPSDPRPLGVVVHQAGLTPTGAPLWPSLWLLLCGAGLGALVYGPARALGAGRAVAWGVATGLAALLAAGIAARPPEVLPFVQRIVALLALAGLGLALARLLTSRRPTIENQEPRTENRNQSTYSPAHPLTRSPAHRSGRWSVRGADLPIYLAVAWWLGPLFQLVMTADGAASVTPAPATAWIGGALALALPLVLGGWYLLRGRALPDEQRSAERVYLGLVLLAVAAVAHLVAMIDFAFSRQAADFWIFFKGAREWARGAPLYHLGELTTDFYGHVFKVPPFFALLLLPFVFRGGDEILYYYRVLDTILLIATALIWLRMWRLRPWSPAGLGLLILLNFRPFTDAMQFGQADIVLLFALTLALWALQRGRDSLAGALVAFGVLLKLYPVLLLAFFVVKRQWRALAGFAIGILAFSSLSVVVMGWEVHQIYLTQVMPISGGPTAWVENQAVAGFLARFVATPTTAVALHDPALSLLSNGVAGVFALLACYLALRPARPDSPAFALQYGQFLLLMILAAPAAWMHYETLLFVPFGALLLHLRDREISLAHAAALAAAFALIAYGNQWSFYDGTVMGLLTVAGLSYKFYGMLLLGGLLVLALLEERVPLRMLRRWALPLREQAR